MAWKMALCCCVDGVGSVCLSVRHAGSGRLVGLSRASFLGMLLAGGFDDSGGAVVGLALGVSFLRGEVARGLCGLLTPDANWHGYTQGFVVTYPS